MAEKKPFQLVCHFTPSPHYSSIPLTSLLTGSISSSFPLISHSCCSPRPPIPLIPSFLVHFRDLTLSSSFVLCPSLPSHVLIITPSILHPFLPLFSILSSPLFSLFCCMISHSNAVLNANSNIV